jgi:cobalt-zinc-cadmium efflux system membrane fusion protein
MKPQLFFLITIMVLYACGAAQREETATMDPSEGPSEIRLTDEQAKKAGIQAALPEVRELHYEVLVNGVVDVPPQNMVSVSFPMGGYLRSTKLLPGMRVRKGEVIGLMEEQTLVQLQQDYLVTAAKLDFLEKEYLRQQALNVDKVNADKTLQQATADYQSQKVILKGYAEKLRLIGIDPGKLTESGLSRQVPLYAPTSGYVSKVNVNVGKYIQPTDVLFELINPDDIHAALTIFEKDLGKIRIGQRVRIFFVDEPDKEYQGEIILVNRNVDENRAAIAHCHFLTQPGQLLPGMFLNARIETASEKGPVVPESALLTFGSKNYVFMETSPNQYRMVEVSTGARDAGLVSLAASAELVTGKKIVVANAYSLMGALKNVAED